MLAGMSVSLPCFSSFFVPTYLQTSSQVQPCEFGGERDEATVVGRVVRLHGIAFSCSRRSTEPTLGGISLAVRRNR